MRHMQRRKEPFTNDVRSGWEQEGARILKICLIVTETCLKTGIGCVTFPVMFHPHSLKSRLLRQQRNLNKCSPFIYELGK